MTGNRFPQLFWGLMALAVALTVSGLAGASAIRAARSTDEITVTGSAKRPIRSDFIVWRGSVTTQGATPAEAYGELRRHTDRVRSFLAGQVVADSIVTFRSVETYAIPEVMDNGRETGRVMGYRLTQWFELRSPDVDGIARVAQGANELISEGVPLMSAPPEYLFTRLPEIRTEILAEATRDARERAIAIAESAGGEIGPVRNARMGVFQITPRNSTEVSDYGINDTSSLDKDITGVVRVTFAVR